MKRSPSILLVAAAFCVAGVASAAGTVVGSRHDLRLTGGVNSTPTSPQTEVCVSCHTPHQAAAASMQQPLWNHTLTATTAFGVYTSATLKAVPTNIGTGAAPTWSTSMLCMSCHDGTVSVISQYNPQNGITYAVTPIAGRIDSAGKIISTASMGTTLVDDHPVNFAYNPALVTLDPGLHDPTVAPVLPLLISGMVQCTSCHDVHDPTNSPFLRVNNTGSALCLTCHIK